MILGLLQPAKLFFGVLGCLNFKVSLKRLFSLLNDFLVAMEVRPKGNLRSPENQKNPLG